MNETPVHEHDCEVCVFLGTMPVTHPEGYVNGHGERVFTVDLYHCEPFDTVIARYGREGEYSSCGHREAVARHSPYLREAALRWSMRRHPSGRR